MWTVHLTDRRIAIRVVKKLFGFSFHEREESFRYKDLKHVSVTRNVTYWKFFFSAVFTSTAFAVVDVIRFLDSSESVFIYEDSVSTEEEASSISSFSYYDNGSTWHARRYDETELYDPFPGGDGDETEFFYDPFPGGDGDETEFFYDPSYGGDTDDVFESSNRVFGSFDRAIKTTVLIGIIVLVILGLILFVIAFVESFCFKSLNLDFYKKERVESWLFTVFDGRFGSATTRALRFSPQQCHAIAKALLEHSKTQLLDDSLRSNRPPTAE